MKLRLLSLIIHQCKIRACGEPVKAPPYQGYSRLKSHSVNNFRDDIKYFWLPKKTNSKHIIVSNSSSEESSVAGSASVSMTTHSSPTRAERLAAEEALLDDPDHDDHYIYVTYPPELKRRLLERYAANQFTLIILTPYIRQTRVD